MVLKISSFENIILTSDYINILEVENNIMFATIVSCLNNMINGANPKEQMIIIDENSCIDLEKEGLIIFDIFNINLNTKKILSKINQSILDSLNQCEEEKYMLLENLKKATLSIVDIIYDFEFDLTFNENILTEDLLKTMSIKVSEDLEISSSHKIMTLVEIVSKFKLYKIIFFVNAKNFFTDLEIFEIYKYIINRNLVVLFIERMPEKIIRKYERKTKIDLDLFDAVELWNNT